MTASPESQVQLFTGIQVFVATDRAHRPYLAAS